MSSKSLRIMVLRTDRLGDLILTSGYLDCLCRSLPEAEIDLWLAPETAVCRAILPKTLQCRKIPFDRSLRCADAELTNWLDELESRSYDWLVVPQFTLGFPEVLALSQLGVAQRWGFRNRELRVDPQWVSWRVGGAKREPENWISRGPEVDPFQPEAEKYCVLAAAQELRLTDATPKLQISPRIQQKGGGGVLIWPGSSTENRRWPAESFAELAGLLALEIVSVGGTEGERQWVEELVGLLTLRGVTAHPTFVDPENITGTVRWLAGFDRVIANDTGVAHLAAAVGVACTSISGSQYKRRFSLTDKASLTVYSSAPCSGCRELCLFETVPYPCLGEIRPSDVRGLIASGLIGAQMVSSGICEESTATFAEVNKGALNREMVWSRRLFEVEAELKRCRILYGEVEQQRDLWASLCHQAEQQRDSYVQRLAATEDLLHSSESAHEEAVSMLADAAATQGDLKQQLCRKEVELSEARAKSDMFYAQFPWARERGLESSQLPKISIVTPSYQQGDYIEETIQSVLRQEYPNFEHIIVDGGSTDQTIDILKRYPHLKWVSERDKGQAHAINKGMLMATGEIVAYLNSDDIYRPGAFHAVARHFQGKPASRFLVGDCDCIDERSNVTGHLKAKFAQMEGLIRYWGWNEWCCIPQQSTFWRRDLMAEVGLFNSSLHMVMDYDMWLRIAYRAEVDILPQTLAGFRIVTGTKTTSRTHVMYEEELNTSRKWWYLLPLRRRVAVAMEARRHFGRKMLDLGEHYAFNDLHSTELPSVLSMSGSHWWPNYTSPRWLLSVLQVHSWNAGMLQRIRKMHRRYLGMKWRWQQRKDARRRVE